MSNVYSWLLNTLSKIYIQYPCMKSCLRYELNIFSAEFHITFWSLRLDALDMLCFSEGMWWQAYTAEYEGYRSKELFFSFEPLLLSATVLTDKSQAVSQQEQLHEGQRIAINQTRYCGWPARVWFLIWTIKTLQAYMRKSFSYLFLEVVLSDMLRTPRLNAFFRLSGEP